MDEATYCRKCQALTSIALGLLIILSLLFMWNIWYVIAVALVIGGVVLLFMPTCGCEIRATKPAKAKAK
jgi:hypothetical protein